MSAVCVGGRVGKHVIFMLGDLRERKILYSESMLGVVERSLVHIMCLESR